jgi:hypothetical protein
MNVVLLFVLIAGVIATFESRGGAGSRRCGWELMQNLRMFIDRLSVPSWTNLILL